MLSAVSISATCFDLLVVRIAGHKYSHTRPPSFARWPAHPGWKKYNFSKLWKSCRSAGDGGSRCALAGLRGVRETRIAFRIKRWPTSIWWSKFTEHFGSNLLSSQSPCTGEHVRSFVLIGCAMRGEGAAEGALWQIVRYLVVFFFFFRWVPDSLVHHRPHQATQHHRTQHIRACIAYVHVRDYGHGQLPQMAVVGTGVLNMRMRSAENNWRWMCFLCFCVKTFFGFIYVN